jgi:hypothetical protein
MKMNCAPVGMRFVAVGFGLCIAACSGGGNGSPSTPPAGSGGMMSGGDPSQTEQPTGGGQMTGGDMTGAAMTGGQKPSGDDAGSTPSGEPDSSAPSGGPVPDVDAGTIPVVDGSQTDVPRAIPQTTEAILAPQSSGCLPCAQMSGCLDPAQAGGTCEMLTGNALNGGLTEAALCRKTLSDIFTSHCAVELLLDPCLCGETDTSTCFDGTETPKGAAYPDYVDDFGSDMTQIQANFEKQTLGAGMANEILYCVMQYGCGCVGE